VDFPANKGRWLSMDKPFYEALSMDKLFYETARRLSMPSMLVRIILIIVVIWLALNVLGDFLNLIANSFIAAIIVIVLILWYLDVI